MSYQVYGNPAFKYGNTGRLYGTGASTDPVTYWTIEVDWDNTGTYNGTSEALYCIGFESQAGRTASIDHGADGDVIGYKMPDVGTCRITLDNSTRRFDPYYTSGALYGKILPGRFVRVRVTYKGVTYPIFHGNISKITPYDNVERPTVVLECEDGKRWLMNGDYNIGGVATNQFPISYALAIARGVYPSRFGVQADPTEPVQAKLSYVWSDGKVSAMSIINDIIGAYGYTWYITGDGVFHAYIEGYGPQAPDIETVEILESNTLKQMALPVPWENITNVVKKNATPRVAKTGYVMWTGVDTPQLAITESFTYFPKSTYNNEIVPSAIGSAIITITANTAADGSGTDLSADFDGVISGADATGCILTVTNNHGSLTGYITSITLTGTVYAPEPVTETTEDAASIAIYGRKRAVLGNRLSDDVDSFGYASEVTASPTFQVQMQARPDEQFALDLFNRIYITIAKYGLTDDLRKIAYIGHKWLDNSGQNVLSTFRLEITR